jgi:transcriptional regulator with XRE-family HTH domain
LCLNTSCYFNATSNDGELQGDLLIRLGLRISRMRRRLGWTQAGLSERVGIDRSFLADVERGKRNISILNLAHIAEGLGVTLAKLFSRL